MYALVEVKPNYNCKMYSGGKIRAMYRRVLLARFGDDNTIISSYQEGL